MSASPAAQQHLLPQAARAVVLMRFTELMFTMGTCLLTQYLVHHPVVPVPRAQLHGLLAAAMKHACRQRNGLMEAALGALDGLFGSSPPPADMAMTVTPAVLAQRRLMRTAVEARMRRGLAPLAATMAHGTEHATNKVVDVCLHDCMGATLKQGHRAEPASRLSMLRAAQLRFTGDDPHDPQGWQCVCAACAAMREHTAHHQGRDGDDATDTVWHAWLAEQATTRRQSAAVVQEAVQLVLRSTHFLGSTLTPAQLQHMMDFTRTELLPQLGRGVQEVHAGVAADPSRSTASATARFEAELEAVVGGASSGDHTS